MTETIVPACAPVAFMHYSLLSLTPQHCSLDTPEALAATRDFLSRINAAVDLGHAVELTVSPGRVHVLQARVSTTILPSWCCQACGHEHRASLYQRLSSTCVKCESGRAEFGTPTLAEVLQGIPIRLMLGGEEAGTDAPAP